MSWLDWLKKQKFCYKIQGHFESRWIYNWTLEIESENKELVPVTAQSFYLHLGKLLTLCLYQYPNLKNNTMQLIGKKDFERQ